MGSCFTPRVAEILGYYQGQNPGVLTNLARLLTHGRLAGTGKLVILPVDQGFEHGPARSFAPEPGGLRSATTTSSWRSRPAAMPTPRRSASSRRSRPKYAGQIPLILKLNNSDIARKMEQPLAR